MTVWVYFSDGHFQIVCPAQGMQLVPLPEFLDNFVVLPHGEVWAAVL